MELANVRRAVSHLVILHMLSQRPAYAYELAQRLRGAHDLFCPESDLYASMNGRVSAPLSPCFFKPRGNNFHPKRNITKGSPPALGYPQPGRSPPHMALFAIEHLGAPSGGAPRSWKFGVVAGGVVEILGWSVVVDPGHPVVLVKLN